jgi:hypothetical protein
MEHSPGLYEKIKKRSHERFFYRHFLKELNSIPNMLLGIIELN